MSQQLKQTIPIPEMISIEGGTFQIGDEAYEDSQPIQTIRLADYSMGKYPVTVQEYLAFAKATQSNYPEWLEEGSPYNIYTGTNGLYKQMGSALLQKAHPTIGISWYNAQAYCAWLSEVTGNSYRLPSESEWEYAARGGRQSKGFLYAGGHNVKEVAWYNKNSAGQPMPVGLKMGNELGLHDMSGNVREWCADHRVNHYNDIPKDGKPYINSENLEKDYFTAVVRGGSWYINDFYCRVAYRNFWYTYFRNLLIGFRLCGFSP